MKTAKFVRDLENWKSDARLYQLSPPLAGNEYAIVSAVCVFGEPETYIFPADRNGKAIEMLELEGSYKGGLDHGKALENAGYRVE
jgi:hypothetical protein